MNELHAEDDYLPLVSVVIATRDRPALLRRALEAVSRQDYQGGIECIVVFDQSDPDLSIEVKAGSRTVRVIQNSEHSPGLAGARNSGIDAASGDYVTFCDDDDEWLPAKISLQVALATREGFATVVTGMSVIFDGKETVRIPTPGDMTLGELVRRRVVEAHPSSVLVRKDALLGSIGLVDERIPGSFAEDYDWILRAVKAGPIGVVSEPLVRVYWGQSMFSQRWLTIIEALDYLVAKHPEFQGSREGLGRIRGQQAFAYAGLGRTREARATARVALRLNPKELRAYLALIVTTGLVSAPQVMDLAHSRGRGI